MSNLQNPGCLVLLIDESAGMSAVMGGIVTDGKASTKSNGERTATAINAFLNQLAGGPDFEVALLGYGTEADGQTSVGSRWGGALAGRDFVKVGELASAPLRVETRTRRIPAPGGFGAPREESVQFPVWYESTPRGKAPQIAAFKECRALLAKWVEHAGSLAGQPIVLHVFSSSSGDGNPQLAVQNLLDLATPAGPPLVYQAHLAATPGAVASLYPSNQNYLTAGSARDLFRRSSPLPAASIAALKKEKLAIGSASRGLLYNAKLVDLIRLLGLVKSHVKEWTGSAAAPPAPAGPQPAAAAPAPAAPTAAASFTATVAEPSVVAASTTVAPAATDAPAQTPATDEGGTDSALELPTLADLEKISFVALVLDRTVNDPFSGDTQNTCVKLQDHANDLLKQLSKFEGEPVDVAIVSYGLDSAGNVEVRTGFEGAAGGGATLRHTELNSGAIRVEEYLEQMSNGIGGIIEVNRKRPIFFDLEPTTAASPCEAFSAVADIAREWCNQHPNAWLAPIVVHLTRGAADPADTERAADALRSIVSSSGPISLYHLVATEAPHKSLAYSESEADFAEPSLAKLWEASSPLLGRERLSSERPGISPNARGIVVNGKFDALLSGLQCDTANSAS